MTIFRTTIFLYLIPIALLLIFANQKLNGQEIKLEIDNKLECPVYLSNDTIMYSYRDSLNNPIDYIYPMNSNISLKSDWENLVLHTISAELNKDTLIIYLTKQSYSLMFDVVIKIYKKEIFSEIKYWYVLGITNHLKMTSCILTLNKSEFKRGDFLKGKVEMDFEGIVFDEFKMEELNTNGVIEGCFNVEINNILKSRLK